MLILFVLLAASSAETQTKGFWVKKNYKTWTEQECRKLLEDSPWARTRVVGRAVLQELSSRTFERGRENAPQVEYRIQLRSAQPVRQALVRLQLIASGYDKLSPEQRQELDAQAEKFLAEEFRDRVVFYIEYSTNMPGFASDLTRYWRTRTTGLVQADVRLHARRGEQFAPIRFVHAGSDTNAFQLTFARLSGEQPILTEQDDELSLEFMHPAISELRSERVLIGFKVRDLLLNGALNY